ncbi:heat shock protein 27-like [Oscarella lobularis]|uniref:heat shock protein 27-like n=1 Tax=Oscarella lobularis TaxID=121494 RepID=UPI0033141301
MALINVFDWDDPWLLSGGHRPGSLFSTVDRSMRNMERDMRSLERQFDGLQRHWGHHLPASGGHVHSMLQGNAIQPTIVDEGDGTKKLHWSFDVSGFKPEDVSIRTQNGKLEVKAKHEDKSDHHEHVREFTRIVNIPEGAGLEGMASKLNDKGLLTIEAPYTPPAIEQKATETVIPVQHE